MKSQVVVNMLQNQFSMERVASNWYLGVAALCEYKALPGFAKWFKGQSEEETAHAMKIYDYLLDIGEKPNVGVVEIKDLPNPEIEKLEYLVPDLFERALENEKEVTKAIHRIVEEAQKENDYAAVAFLQWFVQEQVEEEKSVQTVIDKLRIAQSVFLVDHFITRD
jgi:ferritin